MLDSMCEFSVGNRSLKSERLSDHQNSLCGGCTFTCGSPLKLPWWGRAPSNCRGTLSFLYKMGGPGWRHLYKMECAKKTLENDRAPTYTGDSWWIEKVDVISIIFGGHMSMYKNKDSFCRHAPGHADPLRLFLGKGSLQNDSRFLNITQDTPRCSNKNLYKMSLWKNIYEISPSSIQKWPLQNERTQPHFFEQTLPGIKWWFMRGTCPPILCRKFQGGYMWCFAFHGGPCSPSPASSDRSKPKLGAHLPPISLETRHRKSTVMWEGRLSQTLSKPSPKFREKSSYINSKTYIYNYIYYFFIYNHIYI